MVDKNLVEENRDIEEAALRTFGNEQKIFGLMERMEFAVKMSDKIVSWIGDIDSDATTKTQKSNLILLEEFSATELNS